MEPGSESELVALIGSAAHSVVVENEEMDSTAIEEALEADAQRGVSVTVVMTADSEWDAAFSRLSPLESTSCCIRTRPRRCTSMPR